ncbi:MAG TPA: hypothetical protein EYG95_01985 [Campylobacterales bacterium]|nr:hypothetical protein [Campylobacterales bacterium]
MIERQNPQRVVIESYLLLLEYEGRLHDDFQCFICDEAIEESLVLARSFLPAHQTCVFGELLEKKKIEKLFETKSTIYFEDDEVTHLWRLLQEGF